MEKKIYVNTTANHISFPHPFLKNKKGNPRQVSRGIGSYKKDGKYPQETVDKLIQQLEAFLIKIDETISRKAGFGHEDYILLINNEETPEDVKNWIFDNTEFSSEYNQTSIRTSMEKFIPERPVINNKPLPLILFLGPSAGGKTTTKKQVLGATGTDFLATTQGNSTEGSTITAVYRNAKELKCSAMIYLETSLQERLEAAFFNLIKQILSSYDSEPIDDEDIIKMCYNALTTYDDRKCKLQYIIHENDFNNIEFVQNLKNASLSVWANFKTETKSNKDDIVLSEKFTLNTSREFLAAFDDYLDNLFGDTSNERTIGSLLMKSKRIITSKTLLIVEEMIKEASINKPDGAVVSMTIYGKNKQHTFTNYNYDTKTILETLSYPKLIQLTCKYDNNKSPDSNLHKYFFNTCSHISSGSESKKEHTLYPLVEELRTSGNFRPNWIEQYDDKFKDFVLKDSEGLDHDMTNKVISNELRTAIRDASKVVLVQNSSRAIDDNFGEVLKLLIGTGCIYKTLFCFNRMEKEKFDQNSNRTTESRLKFVQDGIRNGLKYVIKKEENNADKIVTSLEHIYLDQINKNAFYFEYLDRELSNKADIIPDESLELYNIYKQQYEVAPNDAIKNAMRVAMNSLRISFSQEFNTIENLRNLIYQFTQKELLDVNEISRKNYRPVYRADKLVHISKRIHEDFLRIFLEKLNHQPWQTVKAFNMRIAYNYDWREWSPLRPESEFIQLIESKVMSFLLNPENINDEKDIPDKGAFVEFISTLISDILSRRFSEISYHFICERLIDSLWKKGAAMSGTDSTYYRKSLINRLLSEKFEIDYEKGKYDMLYPELKNCTFENEFIKVTKAKYI